jgi:hypothetical protein
MPHTIQRLEYYKDHGGNITSIFLCVNGKEHWLSGEEVTAVLADEAALVPILEEQSALGEIEAEHREATKPMPTVCADEKKKKDLEKLVKADKVAAKKTERLAEIEAEKAARIEAIKPIEEIIPN